MVQMNGYELISPKTNKPCGVFVCGVCNLVTHRDLVEKCCKPCECGKPSRNRFECRCSDCAHADYNARRRKQLDAATEIEWDGEMMLYSEDVTGSRDGWHTCPDELMEEIEECEYEDEHFERPEFVFASIKKVNELDLSRMVERMTEDTYEDAGDNISSADFMELQKHVDAFNAKNAVTYFDPDYKRKIRVPAKV